MYTKIVSERELNITIRADELGVGPNVIGYDPCSISNPVDSDKICEQDYRNPSLKFYYMNLGKLKKVDKITKDERDKLMTMFERLYDNGIAYFDVHYDNIMYGDGLRGEDGPVIIDYGHALYVEDAFKDSSLIPGWFGNEFSKQNLMDYIYHELSVFTR